MAHTIGIDARKLNDFGIGTYIRHLIYGLAEIDAEDRYVLLLSPQDERQLQDLPENFHLVTEKARPYGVRELVDLSWRLYRLKLDLYHSTHYVLPWIVPCKAVVTIHDIIHLLYPEFLPNSLAYFYAQRMIRRSLQRGDHILADSMNTKADLQEYFEVSGDKIRVAYPGVSKRFRAAADEAVSAADNDLLAGLGIRRPYILFVGNPKPHKNLDGVVKAFARSLEISDFDANLVCVGDRTGRDFKIRQRAQQLGIADRVQLVGHVSDDELPTIYRGADLFLYPTLYEGFGLPVVEAMASGVAVITSNTSALKEVAGGYADLVNPLDTEEIAKAIAHCMADPEHRTALRKLGERRARDFSWRRTAELTRETYLQVLDA